MLAKKVKFCCLLLICIACAYPLSLHGQIATADLTGTVRDPSGAVLVGVKVSLTNVDTGISRDALTTESGIYTLTNLSAGRYVLDVEMTGFKHKKVEGIVLRVAQKARIDVNLELGEVSEVVDVQGAAPLVDTETPTVGAVMAGQPISQLPLNGRNFVQLATLHPGVNGSQEVNAPTTDFNPSKVASPTGGGIGAMATTYKLDGGSNGDVWSQSYNVLPPIDSISEFKVEVGSYSAEHGFGGATVVNAITKTGTNQFHGSLWNFHRNDNLDAANFFAVVDPTTRRKRIAPLIRNQFGFVFGGPVAKDRTFFFGSYEGTLERRGLTYTTKVPTQAERSGDLSAYAALTSKSIIDPLTKQPFPNNIIPANRIDSISKTLLEEIYPLPNNPADPLRNYITAPSTHDDTHNFSARIDHQLSDRHKLFARWSLTDLDLFTPGANSSGLTTVGGRITANNWQNVGVGISSVFRPTLINDLHLTYNRATNFLRGQDVGDLVKRAGLLPPLGRDDPAQSGTPAISWARTAMITSVLNLYQFDDANWSYQIRDDLTWIHGKHTLKFGGEIQRNMAWGLSDTVPSSVSFAGNFTGDGYSDFLLGIPASISATQAPKRRAEMRSTFIAGYVQDGWNVNSKLTMDLGMRYEVTGPPKDLYGNLAQWDPTLGNGVGGLLYPKQNDLVRDFYAKRGDLPFGFLDSESIWAWDANNWGPRFGFAYRPFGHTRTTIRSGYGIYFFVDNQFTRGRSSLPPNVLSGSLSSDPSTPELGWNSGSGGTLNDASNPGVRFGMQEQAPKGGKNLNPYVQQWSLSVAQEVSANTVIEAQYLGSKSTKVVTIFDEQYALDGPGPGNVLNRVPFQKWGQITLRHNSGSSNYNGLLLSLERRFDQGLSFKSSYTWSKSLGREGAWTRSGFLSFIQDRFSRGNEIVRSGADLRHQFTTYMIWDLPFGSGRRLASNASGLLNHLIGGWQFSPIVTIRSGFPMLMSVAAVSCNAAISLTCYPNRIGTKEDWDLGGDGVDAPKYRAANFPAPVFAYGDAGTYTLLDQNGRGNVDISLGKNNQITERLRLEFRFEAFNLFNHPYFPSLGQFPDRPTFGRVFTAANPRELQFALKLHF